jgi:hypothetical protein
MFSSELAGQHWFSQVVGVANIVSAAVAVLVLVVAFAAATAGYQRLALLNRRCWNIRSAVRAAGMRTSWFRFVQTGWCLLKRRTRQGSAQVRDELMWLSQLERFEITEPGLSASWPVPVPFTFAQPVVTGGYGSALETLAAAYDAYAWSVRRRWLLRSAAGPLVAQEHRCAKETADLLRQWASFEPVTRHTDPDRMRGRLVQLASHGRPRTVRLVTWPDMTAARAVPVFPAIGVSFQPFRVAIKGSVGDITRDDRCDLWEVRAVADVLGSAAADPLTFDGVLPRWHGPGFRLEIDKISGRQKLHLCVAETTYFAYQATQVPEAAEAAGDAALCSRLLTLDLLVLDEHDVVVLIRRSDYVVHPGRFTGTVSGNCELAPREGLRADLDEHDLPDLLAAIAREAREELALRIHGAS